MDVLLSANSLLCLLAKNCTVYIWCVYLSKTKKLRNMGIKNGCGNAISLILSSIIAKFGGRKCANIVFVCILITYRKVPKCGILFTLLLKKGSIYVDAMYTYLLFVTPIYLKSTLLPIHFYALNLFNIVPILQRNDAF